MIPVKRSILSEAAPPNEQERARLEQFYAAWPERLVSGLSAEQLAAIIKLSKRPPGRPEEWTDARRTLLFLEVEALRRGSGLSVRRACAVLAKHPWWTGESDSTLKRRYYLVAELPEMRALV